MGIRLDGASLDGPVLRRSVPALPGALQVPRSGLPLVLGPEGPTTGGYAQLGMIARVSWTSLAAAPPGASVQFEWTNAERARTMWAERQKLFTMKEAWERV
jgi:allophanate hydrolase subunit 2